MSMTRRIKGQVVQRLDATGTDGAVLELSVDGPGGTELIKITMLQGDVAVLKFHNRPCVHEITLSDDAGVQDSVQ